MARPVPCLTTACLLFLLVVPHPAAAYSVLAHEALVDAAWKSDLLPILRQRFPRASVTALEASRAYAYGGSLIQDLGYYPFGSRFFSNLLHYVRSGDFVAALFREARDPQELAFALGALAHYIGDNIAHPVVNRAVPVMYPKLAREHGPEVLYADSPARHVMVEFAFDVMEVARGSFNADAYQQLIGFEVATPLLERVFRATYGLELRDLFGDVELAIGTYRRAVSRVVPDMTRLAWQEKRDEILRSRPDLTERQFVLTMTRREYEDAFGATYRKPSLLARIVVAIFKVVPKFGPFRPLAFKPLTADVERAVRASFSAARDGFSTLARAAALAAAPLSDTDLDTGRAVTRGRNALADETYDDLLEKLAERAPAGTPRALLTDLNEHFASATIAAGEPAADARRAARYLAILNR
jgi:hypothetical protein